MDEGFRLCFRARFRHTEIQFQFCTHSSEARVACQGLWEPLSQP
jgi:hypothetical protein